MLLTGIHQRRAEFFKAKSLHELQVKKQQLKRHQSLFVKHKSGKPISKELKQTIVNVYQSMIGNVQFS